MDNIRAVIDTLFSQINSAEILHHKKDWDATLGVTEDMFCSKFMIENKCYTIDQVRELYYLLRSDWISFPTECLEYRQPDFFYVLLHFSQKVLIEKDFQPCCRFQELLRWRMLTYKLGEDLFTTSYLAFNNFNANIKRDSFFWPVVLMQDNPSIAHILRKGVCDLHFHLRGSSLNYELNWLSLMNDMSGRQAEFEKLKKCLSHKTITTDNEKWETAHLTTIKAYAIRYYLFMRITNKKKAEAFFPVLLVILQCEDEMAIQTVGAIMEVNGLIDSYKFTEGSKLEIGDKSFYPDYAILDSFGTVERWNLAEKILSGERCLLYNMFYLIFSGNASAEDKWLFYAYLLQKGQIRRELIQLNEKAGFSNFSDYERRKEIFIEGRWGYQELIPKLAVDMAFSKEYLKYLECRITPKDTSSQLIHSIELLERQINRRLPGERTSEENREKQKKGRKHYYILHFIKQRDAESDNRLNSLIEYPCVMVDYRHYGFRRKIKKQGEAILETVRERPRMAELIVGVDAANSELYCRPEVFGPVYRYMKCFCNYSPDFHELGYDHYKGLRSLNFTYHVGEDFWDITDGLRAIDEAVLFLNLKAGDRIGHALALGIDVDLYYKYRNHRVVMSKQNMLDNAAWLHHKARELGIQLSVNVALELENIFENFYDEIYLGKKEREGENIFVEDELLDPGRNLTTYYYSWLLRGDDPAYYLNPISQLTEYQYHTWWEITALNTLTADMAHVRKDKIAVWLYHYYHYDSGVRRRGEERCEICLSSEIIGLIKKVQHAMRIEIAARYISVEANITSNHLIGSFKHYAQHPITQLYRLGLPSIGEEELCPQVSVSVNTDDRGIFDTSIEDEYALLALALEKERDLEGKKRYAPKEVYEWLNNIRRQGFEQQFRKHNGSKYE